MMTRNEKIAKLIYQSKHRGCKENDILLTKFADKIKDLSSSELNLYENFLNEDDIDIYNWLCNINLVPEQYQSIMLLLSR